MGHYSASLLGGALIGASASLLWLFGGKIAGISGILSRAFTASGNERTWRLWFLAGMVLVGALLERLAGSGSFDASPSIWVLGLAGVLIGVGVQLSGGCTSGHGVCGVGRLSRRSLVATSTFMVTAIMTVWLVRHGEGWLP